MSNHYARDIQDGIFVRKVPFVFKDLCRCPSSSVSEGFKPLANRRVPSTHEKNPTTTEYDAIGRVKKITLPHAEGESGETSITNAYNDPWEVVESHSIGRNKKTTRNARGHVLYIEDFGTGDDGSEVRAKMGFAYDAAGNRIKNLKDVKYFSALHKGEVYLGNWGSKLRFKRMVFGSEVDYSKELSIVKTKEEISFIASENFKRACDISVVLEEIEEFGNIKFYGVNKGKVYKCLL